MTNQLYEKTASFVYNPVYGMLCSTPAAFHIRSKIEFGKPLMDEVGEDPHTQKTTLFNENDDPEYEIHETYSGFWKYNATATLILHIPFRGPILTWSFMLQGRFSDTVCKDKDRNIFDQVEKMWMRASRSRFDHKDIFTPRGIDFDDGDDSYRCNVEGDWEFFSGSERVLISGKTVWTATFMGQYLQGVAI